MLLLFFILGVAQAFQTKTELKAALNSCCTNGTQNETSNEWITPFSYDNDCTYNEVHIKDWDVSQIEDFSNVFDSVTGDCFRGFNANISQWDVSKGTDFSSMFAGAKEFNADISQWNVSKGTDFGTMFSGAWKFNADISGWDVSKSTSFIYMFSSALVFNADISGWDVSKATKFHSMFNFAIKFNQDVGQWNINVADSREIDIMFANAWTFDQNLDNWDIEMIQSQHNIFHNAYSMSKRPSWFYMYNIPLGTDEYACFAEASCGTCDQKRHSRRDFWRASYYSIYPEFFDDNEVNCKAHGRLPDFDGKDCKEKGCVDDNTLCCMDACALNTDVSTCLANIAGCWWNLDTEACQEDCSLSWKNEDLRQCSDTYGSCGAGTTLVDGKCKPACTSERCVELVEAYKQQKCPI